MPMERRTLRKLGGVSAAVLTIAGAAVALLQPGLNQGKLSAAGHSVFLAVGHAVLKPSFAHQNRRAAVRPEQFAKKDRCCDAVIAASYTN